MTILSQAILYYFIFSIYYLHLMPNVILNNMVILLFFILIFGYVGGGGLKGVQQVPLEGYKTRIVWVQATPINIPPTACFLILS